MEIINHGGDVWPPSPLSGGNASVQGNMPLHDQQNIDDQKKETIAGPAPTTKGGHVQKFPRVPHCPASASFLRPIRILRGHSTGEWSIKLNIFCGDRYVVSLPHSLSQGGTLKGRNRGLKANLNSSSNNTKCTLVTDSMNEANTSAHRNIVPVESCSQQRNVKLPKLSTQETSVVVNYNANCKDQLFADTKEVGRCESRSSSVSDDIISDSDNNHNISVNDDVEDDFQELYGEEDENDLSMMAGLVSSQLVTNEDASLLDDDDDYDDVLSGLHDNTPPLTVHRSRASRGIDSCLKTIIVILRLFMQGEKIRTLRNGGIV